MPRNMTWRITGRPPGVEEFYQSTLGVPYEPDPVFTYFCGLVKEYREKCEEYDKSICPKRFKGIAIPETTEQWHKVSQFARNKRDALILDAAHKNKTLTAGELEGYWRKAMEITRP